MSAMSSMLHILLYREAPSHHEPNEKQLSFAWSWLRRLKGAGRLPALPAAQQVVQNREELPHARH